MELHSKHRGVATILGVNVSFLTRVTLQSSSVGQARNRNSVRMYRPRPRYATGPPLRRETRSLDLKYGQWWCLPYVHFVLIGA